MILKQYLKHLSLSLLFYLILAILFFIYLLNKNNFSLLNEVHFLRFDALLYEIIKNKSYHENWLCAFFPAFPFFWKLLNVSAIGISILNALIFIFSFSAIAQLFKMDWRRQLFFLSIPSLMFMFVPYTESLFYAAGTLLIIGLKKDKLSLILSGLFLGSLIRPTTFVFIPAILGAYFFTEFNFKQVIKKSLIPTIVLIAGLIVTITTHYYFTGKWFVFFEAQKLWKNYLHFPRLPLTSWGGDGSTRFDASALGVSLVCGAYVINLFSKKLHKSIVVSKDLAFSLLYIFGTTILILAYRDGNLYSLNRFIYATPFIVVVIYYFFEEYKFKWKHLWLLLLISEVLWLLFNSYNHIHNLLLYSAVSFYFALLLFSKYPNKTISTLCIFGLIIVNCIGIIKLYYRFLNNVWVG